MKLRSILLGILSLGLFSSMSNRHIITVLINQNNQLLVEDSFVRLPHLCDSVKSNLFTLYHYQGKKVYRDPTDYPKTIVSVAADRGASYDFYIAANNEIEAAYVSIWEDASYRIFDKALVSLSAEERKTVEKYFPKIISEADPIPTPRWSR